MKNQQGGTILGFVLGLVVGLGIALGVAVYITKVPLPFISKGVTRGADQSDAESKKNKDWDPNALLSGKPAAKAATAQEQPASGVRPALRGEAAIPVPAPVAASEPRADAKAETKAEDKSVTSADPLGALAKAKGGTSEAPQISYFVQVGAFRTAEDAHTQRAKLALTGVDAKVTEREQGGRPLFRVRVGPFEKVEDAERAKDKLDKAGVDTALIKVQR